MPTYDYRCKECGHEFEAFQNMNDSVLSECPKCSGKLERLIGSGSGLIFKGSGFYITDYKKKSVSTSEPKPDSKAKECKADSPSCSDCPKAPGKNNEKK